MLNQCKPLPTKSRYAFDSSCEELPRRPDGKLSLWTFTFAEVISVKEGRLRWSNFVRKLRQRKKYESVKGLRVFELHPGGHGLHVHVVTTSFMWAAEIQALWWSCGGGIVDLRSIPANRASYLSKYLRKQGRPECFHGVRMWAGFGNWEWCKVKDVKVESNWTRIYAYLRATVRTACCLTFDKLRWHERTQAVANVECWRVWWWGLSRVRPADTSVFDPDGWTRWGPSAPFVGATSGNFGIPD